MIRELIKIANELDNRGLVEEASLLDSFIIKLSEESDEQEELGELIDLDQYRQRQIQKSSPEQAGWGSAWEQEDIQRMINEIQEAKKKKAFESHYIIVLGDGETYSSEASIVRVTSTELEQIEAGVKVYEFVPPDHGAPDAKWIDIWDVARLEDL